MSSQLLFYYFTFFYFDNFYLGHQAFLVTAQPLLDLLKDWQPLLAVFIRKPVTKDHDQMPQPP